VYAGLVVAPLKGRGLPQPPCPGKHFSGLITVAGWLGLGLSLGLRRLQTGKAHQYAVAVLLAIFVLAFYLGGH
jgi:hypothetical protein